MSWDLYIKIREGWATYVGILAFLGERGAGFPWCLYIVMEGEIEILTLWRERGGRGLYVCICPYILISERRVPYLDFCTERLLRSKGL